MRPGPVPDSATVAGPAGAPTGTNSSTVARFEVSDVAFAPE
ncbi:hypothetical protein [Halobellus ruber]|nr:hypothetical protein [Halobellus ruber]